MTRIAPSNIMQLILTLAVGLGSLVVVIVDPHTLTFREWFLGMVGFSAAHGVGAIGHGLLNARTTPATSQAISSVVKSLEGLVGLGKAATAPPQPPSAPAVGPGAAPPPAPLGGAS